MILLLVLLFLLFFAPLTSLFPWRSEARGRENPVQAERVWDGHRKVRVLNRVSRSNTRTFSRKPATVDPFVLFARFSNTLPFLLRQLSSMNLLTIRQPWSPQGLWSSSKRLVGSINFNSSGYIGCEFVPVSPQARPVWWTQDGWRERYFRFKQTFRNVAA